MIKMSDLSRRIQFTRSHIGGPRGDPPPRQVETVQPKTQSSIPPFLLYVVPGHPKCQAPVQIAQQFPPNQILIQDIREIPKQSRPSWLRGVPTFVSTERHACFQGSDAIEVMKDILQGRQSNRQSISTLQGTPASQKAPAAGPGASGNQKGAGATAGSGMTFANISDAFDDPSPMSGSGGDPRYADKGKVSSTDIENYQKRRKNYTSSQIMPSG